MRVLRLLPPVLFALIAESTPVFASGGTGFLGLPGAPEPSLLLAFLWAVFVGWVFSTVGAFGGVLAGVGHLTVFGLGDFASSLRSTNPELSARVTDSIRVSNQWLVGTSAFISTFNYYRMRRIVVPLALALGSGAVIGSFVTPILTSGKLSLKAYLGYFGLFTLLVGFVLLYETTPWGEASRRRAYEAARAFEERIRREGEEVLRIEGVRISEFSLRRITFTFFGQEFSFNPLLPFLGGAVIGSLASLLGVGGGFLYVPFLTSVVGLPYFIVAGTSALSVAIGMVVSIFSYMAIKQVPVHAPLLVAELLGVALGSYLGPKTSKYLPERYLKVLFALLAFYVGIRYLTKGFLGRSLLPPY